MRLLRRSGGAFALAKFYGDVDERCGDEHQGGGYLRTGHKIPIVLCSHSEARSKKYASSIHTIPSKNDRVKVMKLVIFIRSSNLGEMIMSANQAAARLLQILLSTRSHAFLSLRFITNSITEK